MHFFGAIYIKLGGNSLSQLKVLFGTNLVCNISTKALKNAIYFMHNYYFYGANKVHI